MNISGKRLTRSSKNAMLAGVCAGLAEYFGIDPTVVRVGALVLSILTAFFPFAVAYVLCAIVMPSDAAPAAPGAPLAPTTPPDAPGGPDAA